MKLKDLPLDTHAVIVKTLDKSVEDYLGWRVIKKKDPDGKIRLVNTDNPQACWSYNYSVIEPLM